MIHRKMMREKREKTCLIRSTLGSVKVVEDEAVVMGFFEEVGTINCFFSLGVLSSVPSQPLLESRVFLIYKIMNDLNHKSCRVHGPGPGQNF